MELSDLRDLPEDVVNENEKQEGQSAPDCPTYDDATSLVPPPYSPRPNLPEESNSEEIASETSTQDSELEERQDDISNPVNDAISIETIETLEMGTLPAVHSTIKSKKLFRHLWESLRQTISNADRKSYALFGLWLCFFVYAVAMIVIPLINIRNCPAYVIMPPFLAVGGFLLTPFIITLLFKPTLFQKYNQDKLSFASSVLLSAFLMNSTVLTGIPWQLMNLASKNEVLDYDPSNIYLVSESTDNYGDIVRCDKLTYGFAFSVGIISHINILIIVLTAVIGCFLCCCCSSWLNSPTRPRLQFIKKN